MLWRQSVAEPVERHSMVLNSGDLCTMEGMLQKHYVHRVPKVLQKASKLSLNIFKQGTMHSATCEPHLALAAPP